MQSILFEYTRTLHTPSIISYIFYSIHTILPTSGEYMSVQDFDSWLIRSNTRQFVSVVGTVVSRITKQHIANMERGLIGEIHIEIMIMTSVLDRFKHIQNNNKRYWLLGRFLSGNMIGLYKDVQTSIHAIKDKLDLLRVVSIFNNIGCLSRCSIDNYT